MWVLNIRLKRRGADSGPPSAGHLRPEALDDRRVAQLRVRQVLGAGQLVEAVAPAAGRALDERVAEVGDVAGGDPDLGRHDDARVQADDVVALLDHRPPPGPLDVVLQLHAQWPVVPHGVDAAVDLRAREDEAAPLGQRDDGVQVGDGRSRIVGRRCRLGGGHCGLLGRRRSARWHAADSPGAPILARAGRAGTRPGLGAVIMSERTGPPRPVSRRRRARGIRPPRSRRSA